MAIPIVPIIAAVATTSVAVGGAISAKKRAEEQAKLLKGASGGQVLAASRTQTAADRLASGAGLSDTEYSRGIGTAEAAVAGESAGVMETIREAPMLSSAAADVIVKKAFARGSANIRETGDKLTLLGIQKAEKNLASSIAASGSAGKQEAAIQKAETAKQLRQMELDKQSTQNFINIFGTAGKSVSNIATAYNKGKVADVAEDISDHELSFGTPQAQERMGANLDSQYLDIKKQPLITPNLEAGTLVDRAKTFDRLRSDPFNPFNPFNTIGSVDQFDEFEYDDYLSSIG